MPTLFLDRDGVLIEDVGYPTTPADVHWIPGVFDALRTLKGAGFRLIVVTNQSAIARGFASFQQVVETQRFISEQFATQGCKFDAVYVAPTHPEGSVWPFARTSTWRKPEPGMLRQAIHDFGIDVTRAAIVGDSSRDIEAGRACGLASLIGFGERGFVDSDVEFCTSKWSDIARILTAKEW